MLKIAMDFSMVTVDDFVQKNKNLQPQFVDLLQELNDCVKQLTLTSLTSEVKSNEKMDIDIEPAVFACGTISSTPSTMFYNTSQDNTKNITISPTETVVKNDNVGRRFN